MNAVKPTINRILIADDVHSVLIDKLTANKFNVLYLPEANRIEIIKHLESGTEGLVIRSKTQIDKELLKHATRLKFVARAGAGMDNIDEAEATLRNVVCFNAGKANADAVGEHTIGLLLMLLNNLSKAHAEVKNGVWLREQNRGVEVKGKTVGIIGFGNTGKAVAQKLSGFGVKVIAYDKYLKNYGNSYAKEVGLNQIFKQSDILTLHIPLTQETRLMINSEFLNMFEKPFYFLNLSRGEIVKTTDLLKSLNEKKVLGAALDVIENESIKSFTQVEKEWFDKLCSLPNVVLTPHIGGWTKESYYKIANLLSQKIIRKFAADI